MTLGYICDRQLLVSSPGYSKKKKQGIPGWKTGLNLFFVPLQFLFPVTLDCPLFLQLYQRGDNTDLTPNAAPLAS